ncbi:PhzF family phenazine biosynthesis protein [Psychromonas sp. GE-S-Ul-11]|uniref:PhzF family phenazine biosynthesis protein n=1 Tax=unclassified Psychromonas TaxID=2614957 RepID=UPI00390CCA1F
MKLDIYVVDAFTEQQFKGNSAAVVPLTKWIDDALMQKIAIENNLSETAFFVEVTKGCYEIRWFSPLTEIDFCGHATLASAFVLYHHLAITGDIEFVTSQVGKLTVQQLDDQRIEMSFPNQSPVLLDQPPMVLIEGLSIKPLQVLKNRQAYVVVLASMDDVLNITYQSHLLEQLAPFDVVVTASKQCQNHKDLAQYDFISRYFWPANGGDEDPVTGSIHACLAPYWAKVLNKQSLVAFQASQRGGTLYCSIKGERILVSGYAVLYLKGKIIV